MSLARQLELQRRSALSMLFVILVLIGQVALAQDLLRLCLLAFVILLAGVVIPRLLREANWAESFLDQQVHSVEGCPDSTEESR
ncbi:hypothetical protein DQ239_12040 [Blastococcus sp. TF02-09]|uniref:hypothetical protein n=1 Tax=Blastococcus sp. TF02-09 TaxID=2250576 RepID=UPI000DE85966|nr:hypothetical protein [Blastococcus sp. TF02-9]RBY76918.1 hypothetical protein DQ239_12040 [Blastococcus sp. TF02-9]